MKDVIKRGGYSVYAVEVEQAAGGPPDVLEGQLVAVPDERDGEVPVAAVRLVGGATLEELDLSAWAADRLSTYKQPVATSPSTSCPARVRTRSSGARSSPWCWRGKPEGPADRLDDRPPRRADGGCAAAPASIRHGDRALVSAATAAAPSCWPGDPPLVSWAWRVASDALHLAGRTRTTPTTSW